MRTFKAKVIRPALPSNYILQEVMIDIGHLHPKVQALKP